MRLELSEEVAVAVPQGTRQAVAEVAARREVDPDEYLRKLVLADLRKRTGFSAVGRVREAMRSRAA